MPMTYTQLQAAVSYYTENTFSAADFATMTRLAEQKVYSAVQLPTLRKTATLTFNVGVQTINLPTDFLSSYSFAVVLPTGEYAYMLNKDVNFIQEAYPSPVFSGVPKYYALAGTVNNPLVQVAVVGPAPQLGYDTVLNYAAYPESITVATTGTSWLGNNFESVLFNGVMVEAARAMKQEPDIVAMYEKQFQESLMLVKELGDGRNRRDAYRSGQTRSGVT